jgi:hypothetical protein
MTRPVLDPAAVVLTSGLRAQGPAIGPGQAFRSDLPGKNPARYLYLIRRVSLSRNHLHDHPRDLYVVAIPISEAPKFRGGLY